MGGVKNEHQQRARWTNGPRITIRATCRGRAQLQDSKSPSFDGCQRRQQRRDGQQTSSRKCFERFSLLLMRLRACLTPRNLFCHWVWFRGWCLPVWMSNKVSRKNVSSLSVHSSHRNPLRLRPQTSGGGNQETVTVCWPKPVP